MTTSLVATGQKITATTMNSVINDVNGLLTISTGTFTAVSSVNIQSVFTAGYSYRCTIVITAASGASSTSMQLMSGGTANTSSVYTRQSLISTSTTVSSSSAINGTEWLISASTGRPLREITVDLTNPNDASATYATATGLERDSTPTVVGNYFVNMRHSASTAFDGFKILASTGTITGTYRVERIA